MATRRRGIERGSDASTPKTTLTAVRKSLDSGIGDGPSGVKSDRVLTIATRNVEGEDPQNIEVRLIVSQSTGHTDHSGRRARRGNPKDVVTRFRVLEHPSGKELVSGSFGNGNGRRDHMVTTAARTLLPWVNEQLALEPVGA